jgi:HK97 gp10 family phage protein
VAGRTGVTVRIVKNDLPKIPSALKAEVRAEISKAGHDIEAAAKEKVPVLTGTLRRSIHTLIEHDGMTAVIGPSVDYGLYVEFGTRRMAARPYMRPAAEAVYPRFTDRVKALLRGLK